MCIRRAQTSACPEGTEPDYERDACVSESGIFIEWGDLPVPYDDFDSGLADGGLADGGLDASILDAGPDGGRMDTGNGVQDAGPGMPVDAGPDVDPFDAGMDAGPPPAAAMARFPWNGYTTGSVHVANMAPVMNHPLRPKLIWEEVDDAHHYQVQMSTECDVADFRACRFAAPELDQTTTLTTFRPASSLAVSMTAPVGARYTWRVRACSASDVCSGWTVPRYLNVGRDDHDYNGDGYADLAIGANQQSTPMTWEGNMFIFFGGPGGVRATPSVTYDNPLNQEWGYFGEVIVAAGDLNADGFADVAVGGNGNTYVFLGGAGGPAASPIVIETGANPGSVGDFNGDGFADLIVDGAVFFGGAAGVFTTRDLSLIDRLGDGFGVSRRGGDVDGDGFADLLIGAPMAGFPESEEGVAYVYLGGLVPDVNAAFTIDNPLNQSRGRFGSDCSAGDFDGDGFTDLVVGARSQDGEGRAEGAIYIFAGSTTGPAMFPSVSLTNPLSVPFGNLGEGVANLGDVNGDGYDDLIGGASDRQHMRQGAAYLFLGSIGGVVSESSEFRNPLRQAITYFGEVLGGPGDVNGDGFNDLVVTAYDASNPERGEGNAFLFFGRSSGVSTTAGDSLDNPADQVDGRFGRAIAR